MLHLLRIRANPYFTSSYGKIEESSVRVCMRVFVCWVGQTRNYEEGHEVRRCTVKGLTIPGLKFEQNQMTT